MEGVGWTLNRGLGRLLKDLVKVLEFCSPNQGLPEPTVGRVVTVTRDFFLHGCLCIG